MRRRIALMALVCALASGSAAAAWVKLSANESYTAYASDISVPKKGGIVEMWTMNDYNSFKRTSRGKMFNSKKLQGEYDCGKRMYRIIWVTTHADRMGLGGIQSTITQAEDWRPAPPGSFDGYVLDRACSPTQRPSILSK
jgi:hypothetical protein